MPKEEIPVKVAPPGACWPVLDDYSWPPKGKYPCVEGDGSWADLTGAVERSEERLNIRTR